jgi:ABC-2 type transport system ATP-binding protein
MNATAAVAASAARDVVIDVNGLTKSFGGRVVVRDLSMQVRSNAGPGGFQLGPSSCGKPCSLMNESLSQ